MTQTMYADQIYTNSSFHDSFLVTGSCYKRPRDWENPQPQTKRIWNQFSKCTLEFIRRYIAWFKTDATATERGGKNPPNHLILFEHFKWKTRQRAWGKVNQYRAPDTTPNPQVKNPDTFISRKKSLAKNSLTRKSTLKTETLCGSVQDWLRTTNVKPTPPPETALPISAKTPVRTIRSFTDSQQHDAM